MKKEILTLLATLLILTVVGYGVQDLTIPIIPSRVGSLAATLVIALCWQWLSMLCILYRIARRRLSSEYSEASSADLTTPPTLTEGILACSDFGLIVGSSFVLGSSITPQFAGPAFLLIAWHSTTMGALMLRQKETIGAGIFYHLEVFLPIPIVLFYHQVYSWGSIATLPELILLYSSWQWPAKSSSEL